MTHSRLTRRHALAGLAASLSLPALAGWAHADAWLDLSPFSLVPDSGEDQSDRFAAVFAAASEQSRPVFLPAGAFYVHDLDLPSNQMIRGLPGQTQLISRTEAPIAALSAITDTIIEGLNFMVVEEVSVSGETRGLIEIDSCSGIVFRNCMVQNSMANGLAAANADVLIEDCDFEGAAEALIYSIDSTMTIRGNRLSGGGNAGIRIWRNAGGTDKSIVTGNRIDSIRWDRGGNGQNGNGVSIYLSDDVIVSDNIISRCAFSAIRVNAGRNTHISGNTCLDSGETAIFSEFAFSGSIVDSNIVDGAATGIAIANLDQGGRLATCTGNIVRNIAAKSEVNPDSRPIGIFAEADTVISNNSIDTVPGIGILAGYGPFVRNIVVSDNVVSNAETGIAASVVQQAPAGPVRIGGNIISGAQQGIVGMEWDKIVSADLQSSAGAAAYPNITVADNSVG